MGEGEYQWCARHLWQLTFTFVLVLCPGLQQLTDLIVNSKVREYTSASANLLLVFLANKIPILLDNLSEKITITFKVSHVFVHFVHLCSLYEFLSLEGFPHPGLPNGPAAVPSGLPDVSHLRGQLWLDIRWCHLLMEAARADQHTKKPLPSRRICLSKIWSQQSIIVYLHFYISFNLLNFIPVVWRSDGDRGLFLSKRGHAV